MPEHPIIFQGEMVRAIYAKLKSQTRRVIKPQPAEVCHGVPIADCWGMYPIGCPYGVPGDTLFMTQGASLTSSSCQSERFWSRVIKFDECWEWMGQVNRKHYGILRWDKKLQSAARVSWQIHNGPIADDLHVLHRCDLPWCVNPKHLFLGTNADNVADKVAKGRQARLAGEVNGQTTLTESIVAEIRDLYWEQYLYQQDIANRFGITQSQVSRIVNNKRWNSAQSPNPPPFGHRTLKVTKVRVERVQEISEEDIRAEGIRPCPKMDSLSGWHYIDLCKAAFNSEEQDERDPRIWGPWLELWNKINAKKGFGWDVNPYVWCVDFEVKDA